MACCGKNKNDKLRKQGKSPVQSQGVRWNGKVCPKCGWVMTRIHKYNNVTRTMHKQWICNNKTAALSKPCNYREDV